MRKYTFVSLPKKKIAKKPKNIPIPPARGVGRVWNLWGLRLSAVSIKIWNLFESKITMSETITEIKNPPKTVHNIVLSPKICIPDLR